MARRGRPRRTNAEALRAFLRHDELAGELGGETAAELVMLDEGEWKQLTSRQAIRKRRRHGEALALLACFHPLLMPD